MGCNISVSQNGSESHLKLDSEMRKYKENENIFKINSNHQTSNCSIFKPIWPMEILHFIFENSEIGYGDWLLLKSQNYK